MKTPKSRIPIAKPNQKHKSKNISPESNLKHLKCSKCASEFFAFDYSKEGKLPFCINCIIFGEDDTP